jgi:hypothetical protein
MFGKNDREKHFRHSAVDRQILGEEELDALLPSVLDNAFKGEL